ncbi:hypothetical protein MY3296_001993 [Beauveria thailandica]
MASEIDIGSVTHGHFDGDRIDISDMRNTASLQCNPRSSAHFGI